MSSVERREVHMTIPVAPEMEIAATAQVSALGEWMEMGRDKIDEVKMAVVEACINAFEHSATPDRKVELSFRRSPRVSPCIDPRFTRRRLTPSRRSRRVRPRRRVG